MENGKKFQRCSSRSPIKGTSGHPSSAGSIGLTIWMTLSRKMLGHLKKK